MGFVGTFEQCKIGCWIYKLNKENDWDFPETRYVRWVMIRFRNCLHDFDPQSNQGSVSVTKSSLNFKEHLQHYKRTLWKFTYWWLCYSLLTAPNWLHLYVLQHIFRMSSHLLVLDFLSCSKWKYILYSSLAENLITQNIF